jgi:hypothetical protein
MRKLIPFLIIALFLVSGFLYTDTNFNDVSPSVSPETETVENKLPSAAPTESLELQPKANSIHRPNIAPVPNLGGSRFSVTTNTIILIDTPEENVSIGYGEQVSITGHLYEDYDNNGTYDEDVDIPIPDASVHVFFAGESDDAEHHRIETTDENGMFTWNKENFEQAVVGITEIKVIYDGQFTINGSAWFDVTQKLNFNEDKDYYLDIGKVWDAPNSSWRYVTPGTTNFIPGNGKFDPGDPDPGSGHRINCTDVIIRDDGDAPDIWDSGDSITRDPLAYTGDDIIRNYFAPGITKWTGPLIDEELPDVYNSGRWADDDGDWNASKDDVGVDGTPGTNDNGEGDGWPDPGEPNVDEDLNFTYHRKSSSSYINVSLWHPTEIDAIVMNSSGKMTNKATVGETIEIIGKLKNTVFSGKRIGDRALKLKIFGNFILDPVRTDNQGNFNYTYTIPKSSSMRVGRRDIDIFFDEKKYDTLYDESNSKYPSYLSPTSLSTQKEIITLRIYRPTHIIFEYEIEGKEGLTGYLFKSISINGSVVDDNNNPLYTQVLHDDASNEIILLDSYKLRFEWGREVNRYYDYLERDLLDPSGNFSITNYPIIDPFQELGDIQIKISVSMNESQTYYLNCVENDYVTVRGHTIMDLWIDQDRDTYKNEKPGNQKGPLADYITRTPFEDDTGKIWNFNTIIVYGRLAIQERPDNGINGKDIEYRWEDDPEGQWRQTTTQPIDIDLNGKYSNDETGMFILPDPDPLKMAQNPPKIINPGDDLGPLEITVRYDDPTGFYDKIEISKEFDVVAMTNIIINPGGGIKGESITITGKLEDDLGNGVPEQNINLYWEDLKGELLEDDKFDPIKLADAFIGNVTTDEEGKFSFYSEEILTRDIDVGQGYVVAIFEGSVPPFTKNDAFVGTHSDEIAFNVSSKTKVKITAKPTRLIRGNRFTIEGTIVETYQGDENPDSKVLLTIADVGQMRAYAKNIDSSIWIQITSLEVEFKSEGRYTLSGIVPYDLNVSQSALKIVFEGTNNGRYLKDDIITYYEVWTKTFIKILEPETIEKEDGTGYFLRDDIYQDKYDTESASYLAPGLVFRIQVLEENPIAGAEPKPVANGLILFNMSGKYSVFSNYSSKFTDGSGYANFSFRRPLTDTDWGYKLPSTAAVELEITISFTGIIKDAGKSYFEATKTLPIDTTHHPPEVEGDPPFLEQYGWLLWFIVGIVIVFLIVFFFAMRWHTTQQRIRGMRRIIKRAADQLIAGNEYTAVIFKSYQKLGVHLRKYGYLRRESETFREFEGAVRRALPIDRMSMDQFLQLLEEARYSSHQIGEGQRNDAIRNLRAIERSLDRIIIDEDAALRALERLETEGIKDTEIIVAKGGPGGTAPKLLKKPGVPEKTKALPKGPTGPSKGK